MSLTPTLHSLFPSHWTGLSSHRHRHRRRPIPPSLPLLRPQNLNPILATSQHHRHSFPLSTATPPPTKNPSPTATHAGRSKKKPNTGGTGRIEGSGDLRRQAKDNARRRSRRLSENRFYRRNNPSSSKHADSFTDEELHMIGLGYDRSVRFLSKDDPNLRHPHDWYKYGRYGPYSWRGIVVGPPIRGRFSDERVTLIGEVRDHEEWEAIEQFDMADDFSRRLDALDRSVGFRHYWVFVRHPKWRPADLPWQQWTLVAEVVLEAGKHQRLDKWSLMARLGNKTRAMITQCAAWFRPDILYIKRPLYQCRFEPQDDFFKLLGPLLDPSTEDQYPCELKDEDEEGGTSRICTYFGGLCKIVKISPKAYVDDVVKAYQKLSDEGKSRCLEFLLTNHPVELLHPYTKEWKVKLEEMEMGCDAPDDDSDDDEIGDTQVTDWNEDSDGEEDEVYEDDDNDDVIDVGESEKEDEDSGTGDDDVDHKESEEYWDEQLKKALSSSEAMENIVKKSIESSNKLYKKQLREEEEAREHAAGMNQEQSREGWEGMRNRRPKSRFEKNRIPPELFLRAAVRPFTYRNLVKEIVLMRHAIIDGDIKLTS